MTWSLAAISKVCKATTRGLPPSNSEIHYLLSDSRQFRGANNTLFVAIKGERHNGHDYIPSLYAQGLRCFLISDYQTQFADFTDASFLEVEDTLQALQTLARKHRQQFNYPVIGITGSNGKTIIKEWLAMLLAADFSLVKSPKSYNSQLGVPLSVWQMQAHHQLGIFEAGISQRQEMAKLEAIISPSLGLFTNLGSAHDEGFTNREEKLQEKLKLFANCDTLIFSEEQKGVKAKIQQYLPEIKHFTWGAKPENDITIHYQEDKIPSSFVYKAKTYTLDLPFKEAASCENALHCLAVMLYLGISPEMATARLQILPKVPMRLEIKQGILDSYLIDDTYNNDLAGLQVALEFLQAQQHRPRKVAIISDIPQIPAADKAHTYAQFAALIAKTPPEHLLLIGKDCQAYAHLFPQKSLFFASTAELLEAQQKGELNAILQQATILLKGARHFALEQLVQRLQAKVHGTVLEINLEALVHNLNFYRRQLQPQTKLMVMVKAFAYGSGSAEIAHLLQFHRVDYLAVAYADEGVSLRQNGITLPIMVMNPQVETFDKLLEYQLEPELYSFALLNAYWEFIQNMPDKAPPVHLKLDTGMRRLGFEANTLASLKKWLKAHPKLRIASFFSHLAAADAAEHEAFSRQQIRAFSQMSEELMQTLNYRVLRHILNSPGILRYPDAQFDMVRLGIGLYGVETNNQQQAALLPISRLKTCISQIKTLEAGETVGYGRAGYAQSFKRIATIAIGYADGFSRQLSNGKGKVWINGYFAPVIGRVCMDMTMVDITGIDANEGDEVLIFGEELPIGDLAAALDTIPYEILTNVSERVKRVFYTG